MSHTQIRRTDQAQSADTDVQWDGPPTIETHDAKPPVEEVNFDDDGTADERIPYVVTQPFPVVGQDSQPYASRIGGE